MLLRLKAIRQEFSVEDGETTSFLVLQVPNSEEELLVLAGDETVKRIVEIRAGLPPEPMERASIPPPPMPPSYSYETNDHGESLATFGGDYLADSAEAPYLAQAPLEDTHLPPPPATPLPAARPRSVEEQLADMRKPKQKPAAAPFRTVPKDDLGYPIVGNLAKPPVVRDGDEDGVSQA